MQPSANAAWRAECARAAAQLVISVPTDTGASTAAPASWRPQLDHALAALGSLQAAALGVRAAVEGSASQLAARAERLAMAKEAADAQLAGLQAAHRAALAAVATLREEAEGRREYVAQLEQELAFLNKVWSGAVVVLSGDKGRVVEGLFKLDKTVGARRIWMWRRQPQPAPIGKSCALRKPADAPTTPPHAFTSPNCPRT